MHYDLPYHDRREAGRVLAQRLRHYSLPETVVLALPRGGVPVAYEVAAELHSPLGVLVVRKLGVPGNEELAFGAIASGGVIVLNEEVIRWLRLPSRIVDAVIAQERSELENRERRYRGLRPFPALKDKTVILVDDGLATGSTMLAAARTTKQHDIGYLIVAVPVGAPQTCRALSAEVEEILCAAMPEEFSSVSQWYADFEQTGDEEVLALLRLSEHVLA